jgi:CheY-like chemotaxis protein
MTTVVTEVTRPPMVVIVRPELLREVRQSAHTRAQRLQCDFAGYLLHSSASLNSFATVPQQPASILVIDDDDAIRTIVRLCLERAGYSVTLATGRGPVLASLTKGQFDMIITDVLMPDIDGTEVIAAAKLHQPNAVVLAMSGGGPHLTAQFCAKIAKALGAREPLIKPFHLEELLTAVRAALEQRKIVTTAG